MVSNSQTKRFCRLRLCGRNVSPARKVVNSTRELIPRPGESGPSKLVFTRQQRSGEEASKGQERWTEQRWRRKRCLVSQASWTEMPPKKKGTSPPLMALAFRVDFSCRDCSGGEMLGEKSHILIYCRSLQWGHIGLYTAVSWCPTGRSLSS